MAESPDYGRFVWYDLMSPDAEVSKQFYTRALGWSTRAERPLLGVEGQPPYTMFAAGATPIGGIVPFNEAYWLGYVAVADVDRSLTQACDLGGAVVFGPCDIPQVGRFAVITDPQDAPLALFQSAAVEAHAFAPQLLEFSWHELATTDPSAALNFYNAMFGWEALKANYFGSLGASIVFGQNSTPYGELAAQASLPGAAWLYHVRVSDVHDAVDRILLNGGGLVTAPTEVAPGEWIARCRDQSGAAFAVRQIAR